MPSSLVSISWSSFLCYFVKAMPYIELLFTWVVLLQATNLAILAIDYDIHIDIDDCVKDFALKKTRRVYF